jgi:hypothetical protein
MNGEKARINCWKTNQAEAIFNQISGVAANAGLNDSARLELVLAYSRS